MEIMTSVFWPHTHVWNAHTVLIKIDLRITHDLFQSRNALNYHVMIIHKQRTLVQKRLLHPRMRYLFYFYSYSIWSKGKLIGRIDVFLCIVCTILFNVLFSKGRVRISTKISPPEYWIFYTMTLLHRAWVLRKDISIVVWQFIIMSKNLDFVP